MGVRGLFKRLKGYSSDVVVRDIRGKRHFRFDASWAIHSVTGRHQYNILTRNDWSGFCTEMRGLATYMQQKCGQHHLSVCLDGIRPKGKLRTSKPPSSLAQLHGHYKDNLPYSPVQRRAHKHARKKGRKSRKGGAATSDTLGSTYSPLYLAYQHALDSKSECQKLVHQQSIDAAGYTSTMFRGLGVPTTMAIAEVDAQLPFDQHQGHADTEVVAMRDTDPIVQQRGTRHLMTAPSIKSGHMEHYRTANLRGGVAGFPVPGGDDNGLDDLVEMHGFEALQLYACVENNDYNLDRLPGIGHTKAVEALLVCCGQKPGWNDSDASRTALLEDVSKHLCQHHPKLEAACKAALAIQLGPKGLPAKAAKQPVLHTLECARLMLCCQPVYDRLTKAVVHATDPFKMGFKTISASQAQELTGMNEWSSTAHLVDLEAWVAGRVNPVTKQPWALDVAALAGTGAPTVAETVMPEAASEVMPELFTSKTVGELKKWLRERNMLSSDMNTKALLLLGVEGVHELGLGDVKPNSVAKLHADRLARDRAAWETVVRAREQGFSVDPHEANTARMVPELDPKLIKDFVASRGANTQRNDELSSTRNVDNVCMLVEPPRKGHTHVRKAHVVGRVGASCPAAHASTLSKQRDQERKGHGGRDVYVSLCIMGANRNGQGGQVVAIEAGCCLLPEALVKGDGSASSVGQAMKKAKSRVCRCPTSCVHITALLKTLAEVGAVGVDKPCAWGRSHNNAYQKDKPVSTLPLRGSAHPVAIEKVAHRLLKRQGQPVPQPQAKYDGAVHVWPTSIPSSKLAEIDKGVHRSKRYRPAFEAYMNHKKMALDARDRTMGGKTKSKASAYPLKMKQLLDNMCECAWSPEKQQWDARCELCKALVACLVYDKGLTKVVQFRKAGARVSVPSKKAGGQHAFDPDTNLNDRNQAIVRVLIERINEEMRKCSGFHSEREVHQMHAASDEAQVVRGWCNQRRTLHNLGMRTNTHAKHNRAEFTDDEDTDAD